METYLRVRDILEAARRFHRQLGDFYDRLSDKSDRQRARLLLDYMERHERYFEQGLAAYDAEGADRLLDTWLQYGPDTDALDAPAPDELPDETGVDEVEKMARRFDEALATFYRDAARLARTKKVRELFQNLAEQQEADKDALKQTATAAKRNA